MKPHVFVVTSYFPITGNLTKSSLNWHNETTGHFCVGTKQRLRCKFCHCRSVWINDVRQEAELGEVGEISPGNGKTSRKTFQFISV